MYENFEKIPVEDQKRILDACFEEFARGGYEQASTNAIVKKAQIPKGTLFYFFGSKKDLFLYVLDYSIKRYIETFARMASRPPGDLFERLLYLGQIRMQFAAQNPQIFQLLYYTFLHTPEIIKPHLVERYAQYSAASAAEIRAGLDSSRFKDGVDIDQVIAMIFLLMEGLYSRYTAVLKALGPEQCLSIIDQMTDEVRQYFKYIQQGVYR